MGASVKIKPTVTLFAGGPSGTLVAAFNRIVWQFRRDDWTPTGISNVSSRPQLSGSTHALTSANVGEQLYVSTTSYTGVYTIYSVPSTTQIILDTTYTTGTVGSDPWVNYLEHRANYYLFVEVLDASSVVAGSLNVTPNIDGYLYADISAILRQMVGFENTSDYSSYELKDDQFGSEYQIRYTEVWDGSSNSPTTYSSEDHYFCNAVRQPGDVGGAILKEYIGVEREDYTAKWLTRFSRMRYWPDMPRDLFYFMPNDQSGGVHRFKKFYDGNQVFQTGAVEVNLTDTYKGNVLRTKVLSTGLLSTYKKYGTTMVDQTQTLTGWNNGYGTWPAADTFTPTGTSITSMINSTGSGYGVSDEILTYANAEKGCKWQFEFSYYLNSTGGDWFVFLIDGNSTYDVISEKIKIVESGTAKYQLMEFTLTASVTAMRLAIGSEYNGTFQTSGTPFIKHVVVEEMIFDYDGCDEDNPIYLSWWNSLGGIDYWLFGHRHEKIDSISEISLFKAPPSYNENLEDDEQNEAVMSKLGRRAIKLGADNLTAEEMEGLKWLLYSPKVQMLTNPDTWTDDDPKWQTVIIPETTWTTYRSDRKNFGVEFEILLPTVNLITL